MAMKNNDELEKQAFEQWADSLGFDLHFFEGEYDDPATANAWKCWKAAWLARGEQESE